jgi:ADP-dependent glucokinase
VDIASRIKGSHFALGGNAPVMAKRFALEGCDVLLAARMTPKLQESLPEGVRGKLAEYLSLNLFCM